MRKCITTIIMSLDTFGAQRIPCEIQSAVVVSSLTVSGIMVVVSVVVVKVIAWEVATANMVAVAEVYDVSFDVENIVVGRVAIVLKFAMPVSSDVVVDPFMPGFTGVLLGVLAGIRNEWLADVSAKSFTVVMIAFECPVTTPLGELRRSAAFACRPLALLDRASVSQTRMPSYHV